MILFKQMVHKVPNWEIDIILGHFNLQTEKCQVVECPFCIHFEAANCYKIASQFNLTNQKYAIQENYLFPN